MNGKPGRVAGTFHDLSDEEKTKAFLQLLEHQLKMDKVKRLKFFYFFYFKMIYLVVFK